MNRRLPPLLLAALAACGPAAPPPEGEQLAPRPDHAAGEYLLRLPAAGRGGMAELRALASEDGAAVRHSYSDRVGLGDALSVRLSESRLAALVQKWPALEVYPTVMRYPLGCGDGSCEPDEAAQAETGRTSTCSLDCGVPAPRAERDELENSPQLDTVGARLAWAQTRGAGIQVCVIDTGYDTGPSSTHPDRPLHLVGGRSFPDGSPDFRASDLHGTHVAGIIAAPPNGRGMVGVAPEADVRIYNVFSSSGGHLGASDGDVIAALDAAVADGCQIVNMSFGGGLTSELEHVALQNAYQRGILLVAAAGNSEDAAHGLVRTARSYPAAYPEVLAVGATNLDDELADFSSTGPVLSLTAPGVGIYSTLPVGGGDREVALTCTAAGRGTFALASYGPPGASGTAVSELALRDCGFGSPASTAACQPVGSLALIQRGPAGGSEPAIPFADKIHSARQQGAAGVILYNHRAPDAAGAGSLLTSIGIGGGVPVPVATLAAGDGELLASLLAAQEEVRCSIVTQATSWGVEDGTSMAAPVVSGVAALLWSRYKTLSNVELRQLLAESAVDLGAPGRDDAYGWGRVDTVRALAQGSPRARCGDGIVQPSSEMCDGPEVAGVLCEDQGFDGVAGGTVSCNARCTGLDTSGCRCLPGRTPFAVRQSVLANYPRGNSTGTLAFYQVSLGGQPVRGAVARISLRDGSGTQVRSFTAGPSGSDGTIAHFLVQSGSGLPAGTYTVAPVISKAAGRCRDDQPIPGFAISIRN